MAFYDFLKASNGSGDAPLMHVTTNRIIGSATLAVDSVVNVPAKFIASSGTLLANGTLDPADTTNFRGHTSGGNLIIDAYAPGNVDAGNTNTQVVMIKPTTHWFDLVAAAIMNLTGFGTPEALTIGNLTATTVTATSVAITGAVLLTGNSYKYTVNATDLSNKYAIITFAHGLAYTPDVVGRVAVSNSGSPTSFDALPFSYIKNKSYNAIPPSLTIATQYADATNIVIGVAIHDSDGTALLAAASNVLQFQLYCSPFPGINI